MLLFSGLTRAISIVIEGENRLKNKYCSMRADTLNEGESKNSIMRAKLFLVLMRVKKGLLRAKNAY